MGCIQICNKYSLNFQGIVLRVDLITTFNLFFPKNTEATTLYNLMMLIFIYIIVIKMLLVEESMLPTSTI
jgi:hypothetical protein